MSSTNRSDRGSDLLSWLVAMAAIWAVGALLFRQIVDSDTWWQVAIGRDILGTMTIPRIDRYTIAGSGRAYHDSHWLFQVFLALADRVGGMRGVSLAVVALWGSALYWCYRAMRRWAEPAACCLLLVITALACSDRFIPRPEVVTFAMVALYYLLLQERRYRTGGHLALFGIAQVVWTNSHGLFVIGPCMAACCLSATLLQRSRRGEGEAAALVKTVLVLLASSLVAPFGWDGWRYAWLLATEVGSGSPALFKNLLELAPTFGSVARSYPDFWLYLLILLAATAATIRAAVRREASYERMFLVGVLFLVSLTGRRNMPFFALTAAPLIAENGSRLLAKVTRTAAAKVVIACLLIAAGCSAVSGYYYRAFRYPYRFGIGISPEAYSPGLPAFLRRIGFAGRIYTPPYLGGYAMYHGLAPLVDGRWEVYDMSELRVILDAPYDQGRWERLVDRYALRGAVVGFGEPDTDPLHQRLARDKRFRLAYKDNACTFWLRTAP